ncbi:hypothetical protein GOP47_0003891 [Adiantum capillus-veneris]|uniref:RNase III domain-containing protein n=1 Tax=Adiantum capillus-veneris TaxID=13818 RepID=A0A9D4ZM32_ADICA|nr:hypothetical protein GOP47_0003891 [Adiantum capillus-veneris]
MAEVASSKLGSSFVHTQSALSSSESLFSAFPLFNFAKLEQPWHNQQNKLFIKAAASTVSSPSRSTSNVGTQKRPPTGRPPPSPRPSFGGPRPRPSKPRRRLLKKEGMPPPFRRRLFGVRDSILRPPLDDKRLADKFLRSPQLALKSLPLLSSCLPYAPLHAQDEEWMQEFLPEIKEAIGHPLAGMDTPTSPDAPLYHLDTLLFLAFQHPESPRGSLKYLRVGHSRLAFLGEYILELALAEYFIVRCIYPDGERKSPIKLQIYRGVFWALVAALYLCMGMPEVYRLLFEVFGFDPDAKSCQPRRRLGRPDVDFVFSPLEEKQMEWKELSSFKTADDGVFAKPLLFRACVPPGMQRFRGNLWEIDSLPQVLQTLGYPRPTVGEDPETVKKRNSELELGLQLCFLHPSIHKVEHPRFCNERLEYLGSKVQDVVMAEKLLMKHLDAPGFYVKEKHRRLLFNRLCGKYFREKKLQRFMIIAEARKELFDKARRLRNFATTGCSLALHALSYVVYGKAEQACALKRHCKWTRGCMIPDAEQASQRDSVHIFPTRALPPRDDGHKS